MARTAVLEGGFTEPVFEAQSAFRAIMRAMSEPGSVQPLMAGLRPPAPLSPVMAAVVCTLCDVDTPIWLDPALAAAADALDWIGFHTGAQPADDMAAARFALIADAAKMPPMSGFAIGTDAYPDRSATLVIGCAGFAAEPVHALSGPGIRDRRDFRCDALTDDLVAQWAANRALFPCGVDLILAGPDAVAALPRTTRITAGEG
ncbi:phosphonate C-P lyase system protein PhnH [Minwuia sp.]|uniref:phosphonate C-P lyase system protein PhnH n=1 Tax=Minwuia sp. TaxID=2493630 RepID=UPI003A91753D